MRILGKYIDPKTEGILIAQGGYVATEVQSVYVETYNGGSVDECDQCLVALHSGYFIYKIIDKDGNYLSPETANFVVRAIAASDVFDLDQHGLALCDALDIRPEMISVSNELDEDYNPLPVEVFVVNH